MIKLETLRVFLTVAECGNIADAGDRLGRTGSAISMSLKRLEDELGGALFESDRKSHLTALGKVAQETARDQVRNYDAAIANLRSFAETRSGRLGIAAVPSVATKLLPVILPHFMAARPDVEVELFDLDSAGVLAALETGRVDFGIAGLRAVTGGVDHTNLFSDSFMLVCAENDPVVRAPRPVKWHNLSADRLIVNGASEGIDHPDYRALSKGSRKTVHNVTSLFALAGAGVGVTLLPALATMDMPSGVVALEFEDLPPRRSVALLSRRESSLSPLAVAFQEHLIAAVPTLVDRIHHRLGSDAARIP